MKRYDLQQIMKTAHRTYKYVGKKQGKTFGEVLKSTWRMAKMTVSMEETIMRQEAQRKAEAANRVKVVAINADYKGNISDIALYGRAYTNGGHFVND